mmetsp:Transcript_41579/g.48496  ORF Transcript_41579/g.48496 Transcript_41579/m.48496 type:complete len:266 (+) Transcript_41579:89-886(+)
MSSLMAKAAIIPIFFLVSHFSTRSMAFSSIVPVYLNKSDIDSQKKKLIEMDKHVSFMQTKDVSQKSSTNKISQYFIEDDVNAVSNRRNVFKLLTSIVSGLAVSSTITSQANAAPPFAVIAEELGYFPVTNRDGETINIPARVTRHSTDQAILLSEYLKSKGSVMYGAFWCPHCRNQREIWGREAWDNIGYVECSSKGYKGEPNLCALKNVDGFPTWSFGKESKENGDNLVGGEMPLEQIAKLSGYKAKFDATLEPSLGAQSGSCQ